LSEGGGGDGGGKYCNRGKRFEFDHFVSSYAVSFWNFGHLVSSEEESCHEGRRSGSGT
jgi:hypothetical protein